MRTAIHYDEPEPSLTDLEVREMQEAWDLQSHHLMPPTVPEGSWELWQWPLGLLALVVLWTLAGGLFINYVTTGRMW